MQIKIKICPSQALPCLKPAALFICHLVLRKKLRTNKAERTSDIETRFVKYTNPSNFSFSKQIDQFLY